MLELHIPEWTGWDSKIEEFRTIKGKDLILEHSLISISKWESKWHKSFFDTKEKTLDEIVDYIRCMVISKVVTDDDLYVISHSEDLINQIKNYIDDPMTATVINDADPNKKNHHRVITSELIYYKMTAYGIPFECQKWHINRLLMLINVCDINNQPQKRMSKREILTSNAELNKMRRAKMGSRG